MHLRLIEIVLPEKHTENAKELLEEHKILDLWEETVSEGRVHLEVLVSTGNPGGI